MQDTEFTEVVVILISSSALVLILGGILVFALLTSQKRKFRHGQALAEMKNSYEKEILRTQLEIQTQTFKTISRELHDNVGTLISIAMVHIESLPPIENVSQNEKIKESHSLLDEAMESLRDISKSLDPEKLYGMGLVKSIAYELEKHRKTGLFKIDYNVKGNEFSIDPQRLIILFRMVQEALTNITKHAEANSASVDLNFVNSSLEILIKDNGKGFSTQFFNISDPIQGSGLRNMESRAKLVGATLEVKSADNQGTLIKIHYQENNQNESTNQYQ